MDATEIVVLVAGLLLVGLVLWYFFGERGTQGAEDVSAGTFEGPPGR